MSETTSRPSAATSVDREKALTIFQSHGERQAKLIRKSGKVERADHVLTYAAAAEHTVGNFAEMRALLVKMSDGPRVHLARGGLIGWEGKPLQNVRRLSAGKADGSAPTVYDAPRRWLFLDVDDMSDSVDWRDLPACGHAAVARLPVEFHRRQFIVCATGSHGLPGKGARVRLVFLLDRALTCAEIKVWLRPVADAGHVDAALFVSSQPIYTARPAREDGAPDHVARRVLLVPGPVGEPVAVTVPPVTVPPPRARLTPSVTLSDPDLAALAEMVRATPNRLDRSKWIAYGHALLATFDEYTARELWTDFCSRREDGEIDPDRDDATLESLIGDEHRTDWRLLAREAENGGVALPACVARLQHVERLAEAADDFDATEDLPDGVTELPDPPEFLPGDPVAVASSEDALALEFSRRHAGQVIFLPNGSGWHIWSGHVWGKDEKKSAFDLARVVCRDHARRLQEEEAETLARKISSSATRAAVLSIASADPRHARSINDFDVDPWILNAPDGVWNLRTGGRRPHRHGEPVTKCVPVAPGGGCPTWLRFLSEALQNDHEQIAYLQRWFGYTLTGSTIEQQFLFLYGPGGNGKSVITQTLAAAIGGYATTATPDVFTATRSDQHLAHVAALRGARMVMAPETEEGRAWAEGRLKSLVAADRQSARFMRGDPFEFTPCLKLWICGNHLPRLANVDEAMRRRTRIMHLTFRPTTPDPFLVGRLREELGGILAWGIAGCLEWQRQGLGMPEAVRAACDSYFAEQDVLSAWIGERLEAVDPNASEGSRDLFGDWREFAMARREQVRTETWFGEQMQKRFVRRHTQGGKRFFGVRLKPTENSFPLGAADGSDGSDGSAHF